MNDASTRHRKTRSAKLTAIGRSFDVYYRDRARTARMDRLNAAFVTQGARVFDIGAHVGDRTGSFLRLGASVVALEPQPHVFRALRLLYGRRPDVALLPVAAGAMPGELTLHLNSRNPTVATAAPDFMTAAAQSADWRDQVWDDQVTVPTMTLDGLIARYGTPDFVKIDVEGHEPEVLEGLGTALPALSFEFTTIQRRAAHRAIDRLSILGDYEYNLSLGEEHNLRHPSWLTPDALRKELDTLPDAANSGDIYARRI